MPIRADAQMDMMSGKVVVSVVMTDPHGDNPKMYYTGGDPSKSGWANITEGIKTNPTLTLQPETAELIMEALIKHFGPPPTPEPVIDFRAEYMTERQRVDKLLDVVAALAEN